MKILIDKEDYLFPNIVGYKKDYLKLDSQLPQGVVLEEITNGVNELVLDYLDVRDYKGIDEKFINFAEETYNSGIVLYIPRNTKIDKPIRIEFKMDEANPTLVNQNIIVAEEGSQVTLIIDYNSYGDTKTFHNGFTKVYAKENSNIDIIKIQRLNDSSENYDSNIAYVKGNGKVNWISLELGSDISSSNFHTILEEEGSQGNISSIYLGDKDRKLELEYTLVFRGPRSVGNIETKGALMDRSHKLFKGNLDFKQGARHAKGLEEEFAILLDPTIRSESIPTLLCHEDDIEGEHAASAGQIDENKLFYLKSRGLSEVEAKKLIIEASFRPIIDMIPLEEYRRIVGEEVERRLINVGN